MFFLILLMLIQPVQAQAASNFTDDALVCMDATQKFEKKYQIKEHLLTTISNVETGKWNKERNQSLAWPWTINAKGKGTFFATKAEAVQEVKRLQKLGVKSIDVGCMQINLAYHPDAFASVEEAFDPKKNVEYSAKFLRSLYEDSDKGDWIEAAMAYHSKVPHKAARYKKRLVSAYEKVKQASLNTSKQLFNKENAKPAKAEVKVASKIDSKIKSAKNLIKLNRQEARAKALAWREAKLEEYRRNKIK